MKKSELKTAKDNEIIMDCIVSYRKIALNENFGLPIKAIDKHLNDLNAEMVKRGLLTQEQIDRLNG